MGKIQTESVLTDDERLDKHLRIGPDPHGAMCTGTGHSRANVKHDPDAPAHKMKMKRIRMLVALSALLAIAFATSSARAEHERRLHNVQAPADPSGGKLDNGLTSLTELVPPVTKVFDYSGSIWERGTMFGDIGGVRNDLYDKGFTLDAQLTQVYQGVTSGGNASGNGSGSYNGLLEINSTLDTAKLGLWSGGLIATTFQASFGDPLESEAGNVSPVNMTPLWPKPFNNGSNYLMEYYLLQDLPYGIELIAGRIDPTNFLDKNSLANNPESQFFNASLNNQMQWGAFLSFSTYATILVAPVTKGVKIAFAGWTPSTEPGDDDGDWTDYGVVVNPIIDYHAFGQPGAFQAAIAYSSKDAVALDNPRLAPGLVTGNPPTEDENWLLSIVGEQYFWTPPGASVPRAEGGRKEDFFVPTQDLATNRPGVGLFYRFGYSPKDRNLWNISVSGGIGARGVIPGRPHDRMGIGVYAMLLSDDVEDDDPLLDALLDDEYGVEAFYNYAITPWLQLSASAQWVSPGIESSDDAWVLGSRLNMRF